MDCINDSIAAPWKTRAECETSTQPGIWECSGAWPSASQFTGYSANPTHGMPLFPASLMLCANIRPKRHSPWSPQPRHPGCLDDPKGLQRLSAQSHQTSAHAGGLLSGSVSTPVYRLPCRFLRSEARHIDAEHAKIHAKPDGHVRPIVSSTIKINHRRHAPGELRAGRRVPDPVR